MPPELGCAEARPDLSARLDDELDQATAAALDAHLKQCPECRGHERALERVRRALRAQPAGPVPDLSGRILQRVGAEGEKVGSRRDKAQSWAESARVAAIAAVVAALVVAGASSLFTAQPPHMAAAGTIASRVRAAARQLDAYRASFEITERGWHPEVGLRRFTATVAFDAPERFRLRLRDHTPYPASASWPRNDVDVVANARRWWIKEPSSCPIAALPGCAVDATTETRTIVHRQPFDGTSSLPTDIIVPLETLASSSGFEVVGEDRVLGRRAYRVALPYRQAIPLVMALEAGGSWRSFDPFDRVEIWIDKRTWFPLRFTVTSASSSRILMRVQATSFSQPNRLPRSLFVPPTGGLPKDGGFKPVSPNRLSDQAPRFVAGLSPYRAGTSGAGRSILAYADGMTWLKVIHDASPSRSHAYESTAEEIALGAERFAYYEPATQAPASESLGRRMDIYGDNVHVHLESNLSRADLVEVAESVPLRKTRVPARRREGGLQVRRLTPRAARTTSFVQWPAYLPPGYRASAAFRSRSLDGRETVTVYFRRAEAEYDGYGIRLTQSRPVKLMPPTSETFRGVDIGSTPGRWSDERGELEWRRSGTYRAVLAPSFGASTALRIAESLR